MVEGPGFGLTVQLPPAFGSSRVSPGHSLPRSPSCTFPCTCALCPRVTLSAPSRHPPLPCSAIALPRPLTAPSRAPAHQPRAALSRSAPVPFLHLPPCTPAPSPCTVIAHLPPCTSPCTVIALCPGPLPAPSPVHPGPHPVELHNLTGRIPLHVPSVNGFLFVCAWLPFRSSFVSSPVGTAIPPYTASELFVSSFRTRRLRYRALAAYRLRAPLFALCPGPLPALPVPVHRYRSLPRSPPCPFPTPSPCTVRLVPLPSAPRSLRTQLPLRLLFPDASASLSRSGGLPF